MKNQPDKAPTKKKKHVAPRPGNPKLTINQKKVAKEEDVARRHREAVMHQPVNDLNTTEFEN